MSSDIGIVSYAAYIPRHRVSLDEISTTLGIAAGRGDRVAAAFDEDSTTMGVEAARAAVGTRTPGSLYFATTSPPYVDKTNALAIHAALGLPRNTFAADVGGAARSGVAALRSASTTGGLAVLADVITGRPGSSDERGGGDGAAAFVFGPAEEALAVSLARIGMSEEFLDRWRVPGDRSGHQWEERFGLDKYLPLIEEAATAALSAAGIPQADHVAVVSSNSAVVKRSRAFLAGRLSTSGSGLGYAGAAGIGVALTDVLDRARPGETILLISAADGCDAFVMRTTERIDAQRQSHPTAAQLEQGRPLPYAAYLKWRGFLDPEPPRRPEPDRVAAPPSSRALSWKFEFSGTRCTACQFMHLPPSRVCKNCGAVDQIAEESLISRCGTVATYTVDRLAFSPSPPVIEAVVDFDGGGRYTLEVADSDPGDLAVGTRVGLSFRRLNTAGGVHNYFWKARTL
ncbi:OB-fold domain-containing protein [Rhodococcus aetherivorans]|uniref:OB-fold domain-containing protein n=1 Tax=Rhodococcus aetherivorans TaxID=191292 RepID=UPI0002D22B6C|nr:OB-fold domain-containing protein [Rhodococcus aetherivorans]CCW13693.1 Hydroxymethylglutaryl-CoA synthase [Rhodococcus aetherivorans]